MRALVHSDTLAAPPRKGVAMVYRFDRFELDTESFELRCDGVVRHVEPQVFELIGVLCAADGRVVGREELMDAVWGGRVVSDATISTAVKFARKALDDSGEAQRLIKTVRGRGFRLMAETAPAEPGAPSSEPSSTALSVVILPFVVLSEDLQLAFFADGLAEDLTGAMARSGRISVVSSGSACSYRGERPSAARLRAELGVTHAVTGSIRPLGEVARISVELIETAGDTHLWSERFDRPAEELFALQDEIIRAIARLLEPRLSKEVLQAAPPASHAPDALQAFRRADSLLAVKGWRPEAFDEAADLLRQAVAADPGFARAHALLALVLGLGQRIGVLQDREAAIAESVRASESALALDDSDATVLGYVGCALSDVGRVDRGLPVLDRALEVDPSNAQAWAARGAAKLVAGDRPDEAIDDLRHGIQISPMDNRLSVWGCFLAMALLVAGCSDEALAEADLACRRDVHNPIARVIRAAILLIGGHAEEAGAAFEEARALRPALSVWEVESVVGERIARLMRRSGFFADLAPVAAAT